VCCQSIVDEVSALPFDIEGHDDLDCDRQTRPLIAADARFGTILAEAGISAGCPPRVDCQIEDSSLSQPVLFLVVSISAHPTAAPCASADVEAPWRADESRVHNCTTFAI
jgi:hypothetical protein